MWNPYGVLIDAGPSDARRFPSRGILSASEQAAGNCGAWCFCGCPKEKAPRMVGAFRRDPMRVRGWGAGVRIQIPNASDCPKFPTRRTLKGASDRPADVGLSPRCCRDGPHPGAVMVILPAQCAVCLTRLPVQVERRQEDYAERSGNRWVSV
jgi:hypothetical protein